MCTNNIVQRQSGFLKTSLHSIYWQIQLYKLTHVPSSKYTVLEDGTWVQASILTFTSFAQVSELASSCLKGRLSEKICQTSRKNYHRVDSKALLKFITKNPSYSVIKDHSIHQHKLLLKLNTAMCNDKKVKKTTIPNNKTYTQTSTI